MTDQTRTAAEYLSSVIHALAGSDSSPRPDQERAMTELVDHSRTVLVVQATG